MIYGLRETGENEALGVSEIDDQMKTAKADAEENDDQDKPEERELGAAEFVLEQKNTMEQRKDTGRPYSFSMSPWWKNSSNKRMVQSTAILKLLVCVETSDAWTMNSMSVCLELNSFFGVSLSIISD